MATEDPGRGLWTVTGKKWSARLETEERLVDAIAVLVDAAADVHELYMGPLRKRPGWRALAIVLPLLVNLQVFFAVHCWISGPEARDIVHGLADLPRLEMVFMAGNGLTGDTEEAVGWLVSTNWRIRATDVQPRGMLDRPYLACREPPQFRGRAWFAMIPYARMITQLARQLGLPRGIEIELWLAGRPREPPNKATEAFVTTEADWLQIACRFLERLHVRTPVYRPRGCNWDHDLMACQFHVKT